MVNFRVPNSLVFGLHSGSIEIGLFSSICHTGTQEANLLDDLVMLRMALRGCSPHPYIDAKGLPTEVRASKPEQAW